MTSAVAQVSNRCRNTSFCWASSSAKVTTRRAIDRPEHWKTRHIVIRKRSRFNPFSAKYMAFMKPQKKPTVDRMNGDIFLVPGFLFVQVGCARLGRVPCAHWGSLVLQLRIRGRNLYDLLNESYDLAEILHTASYDRCKN